MESWKKAVVAGSAIASTVMFLKKKPGAGIILGGIGLIAVASEYPEQFARVRRRLPEYLDRGMQLVEFASSAGERISEFAARRAKDAWEQIDS